MRENLAVEVNFQASRRRPQPIRSLYAKAGTKQITLTWVPPQSASGVLGFNIYQGNESTRIANINNPSTLTWLIQGLVTGTAVGFYVSCYNALLESIKTQVIATPA